MFQYCTDSGLLVPSDGNFLAVASHDNFVYIYAVTENGRKYSRVGKCTVSKHSSNNHPHYSLCLNHLKALKNIKMK